ncbi:MAG: hypothetical protein AN488_04895 [Anabaena sp. WA113]|nr:MAG: hypothetical protein AN488_04895 [Anabaena sp. WA113]
MIMVNQNILILRPKFNIFWAIFIRLFLTFNTSGVINKTIAEQVQLILTAFNIQIPVNIYQNWYY